MKINNDKESIFRQAVIEATELELERTLKEFSQSPQFEPSEDYTKTMQALERKASRPLYSLTNTTGKRVATIILATLAALTISTFTLYQTNAFGLKTWFDGWVSEMFDRFSISRSVENPENKNKIEEVYTFSPVPDGWELTSQDASEMTASHIYNNAQGYLRLHQYTADVQQMYDTEDAVVQVVKIGKTEGQYVEKNGAATLLWWRDGYQFVIKSDSLDKDQIIDLAKNIKLE